MPPPKPEPPRCCGEQEPTSHGGPGSYFTGLILAHEILGEGEDRFENLKNINKAVPRNMHKIKCLKVTSSWSQAATSGDEQPQFEERPKRSPAAPVRGQASEQPVCTGRPQVAEPGIAQKPGAQAGGEGFSQQPPRQDLIVRMGKRYPRT